MVTKRIFKRLPLVVAGLAMGLGVFISVDGFRNNKQAEETTAYYTPSTHYEVSDTASELASYYSSISDSDSGTTLLSKLQSLNSSKRKRTMGYSTIGTDTGGAVIYTDYDLNSTAKDSNGQTYGTKVASFYTKTAATSWNREHMWPNSHGGNNVEADILHTRPTISSENSSRGNSFYVEGKNSSSAGWDPYTAGYDAECRGECARVILYCVVAYPDFTLSDADSHSTSNSNKDNMMGNMNTLIKWHFNYLPNIYEKNRNDGAEYLQGNRNPFVDHPEYVAKIWSNFNSTVSSLCTQNANTYSSWTPGSYCEYGSNTPVGTVGVSISKTSASITVDGTTTISATSSDSSTITWSTSNSSVASISKTSAASGSSITITGVSAGTATITARATISGVQYTKTCSVTVTASGGSSGSGDSLTISVSDIPSQYSSTSFTSNGYSFGCSNIGNSYTAGSMQWKSGQGYMYNTTAISGITSISMATSGGTFTGTVYVGSSSHPTSGTSYTLTNGNSVSITGSPSYFTIQAGTVSGGAKCGDITIYYGSSSTKTLSSISVETAPTKTSYTVGQNFDPTGLVINRYYSDSTNDTYTYSGHTSEFTFSPTTSTALTTSHTSVTINYGGKSCNQSITVTQPAVTSITASVSKTYYVGETISASDITVKDNNNNSVNSFTFADDGYQFTYEDASSGGALTNKLFNNSITGSGKTCSLTVQVQRKAYVESSSVTDTLTADDLTATGTTYTDFSGVNGTSGAVYAGQSAKDGSGNIQLRSKNSNSGIISTTSGGYISSVKITVGTGTGTIDVYGKNTAYSSASDLFGSSKGTLVGSTTSTGTINFSTAYSYVGIRSNSGAVYISSIEITYGGSSETPTNIANYIMFEDTSNQCTTKLSKAVGYLGKLSSSDLTTFANSNDYVISTARTRLNAWAASQGKTINYSNATMSNRGGVSLLNSNNNNNAITLVIIISMVGMSSIGICLYIRKKRFHI